MKNKNMIIVGIGVISVGILAFFGGMQYQKSQVSSASQRAELVFGEAGQRGTRNNGNNNMMPISGEILSSDTTGITVKMQDGSSKIVIISGNTSINKTSKSSKADLKTGEKVTAFGTQNADGSITAQNVAIGNATMFRGIRGGGQRQQSSQ